jgi:hypothetical protein
MQGNAVMRAKRVTGMSANRQLQIYIACERCNVAGCTKPVVVTKNTTGINYKRTCLEHVPTLSGR